MATANKEAIPKEDKTFLLAGRLALRLV